MMAQTPSSKEDLLNKKITHFPAPALKNDLERLADQTFLVVNTSKYGMIDDFVQLSEATAFAYKRDAKYTYLVTNYHVVRPHTIDLQNNNFDLTISMQPDKMQYRLYDNGIEYNEKGIACLLYADKEHDVAVLYTENSPLIPFTPIDALPRSLHLGDQVYLIGFPAGAVQETATGSVSSRTTSKSSLHELPIPGYTVQILNNQGVSGSGIFLREGKKTYLVGIAQSKRNEIPMLQIVPQELFYPEIMMVTAQSPCECEGQLLSLLPGSEQTKTVESSSDNAAKPSTDDPAAKE
jgi:S1-C subfamily serine protease